MITDDRRRLASANAAACRLLGTELGTFRTMRLDDFFPREAGPVLEAL